VTNYSLQKYNYLIFTPLLTVKNSLRGRKLLAEAAPFLNNMLQNLSKKFNKLDGRWLKLTKYCDFIGNQH